MTLLFDWSTLDSSPDMMIVRVRTCGCRWLWCVDLCGWFDDGNIGWLCGWCRYRCKYIIMLHFLITIIIERIRCIGLNHTIQPSWMDMSRQHNTTHQHQTSNITSYKHFHITLCISLTLKHDRTSILLSYDIQWYSMIFNDMIRHDIRYSMTLIWSSQYNTFIPRNVSVMYVRMSRTLGLVTLGWYPPASGSCLWDLPMPCM